jgi:hypothetical protein
MHFSIFVQILDAWVAFPARGTSDTGWFQGGAVRENAISQALEPTTLQIKNWPKAFFCLQNSTRKGCIGTPPMQSGRRGYARAIFERLSRLAGTPSNVIKMDVGTNLHKWGIPPESQNILKMSRSGLFLIFPS